MESIHLSVFIDRPVPEVYDYAVEPTHLPSWAPGLSASVEEKDGLWWADSPMGRVSFVFVPRNEYGVIDHEVTLPNGVTVTNQARVLTAGTGSEVVFTVRRSPGASADEFAADVKAVRTDLDSLKRVLES